MAWICYLMSRACLLAIDFDNCHAPLTDDKLDFDQPAPAHWLSAFAVIWFGMSFTIAFSGIGASGSAVHMVDNWCGQALGLDHLRSLLGDAQPSHNFLWAIEDDVLRQRELLLCRR